MIIEKRVTYEQFVWCCVILSSKYGERGPEGTAGSMSRQPDEAVNELTPNEPRVMVIPVKGGKGGNIDSLKRSVEKRS